MGRYFNDSKSNIEKRKEVKQYIGRKLKELRVAHHDKQKDVAELCGISAAQVSRAEHGKSDLEASVIPLLADRYDIAAERFFSDQNVLGAEIIQRLIEANKLEGKSKTIVNKVNYLTNQAIGMGNADTLLRLLYAALMACSKHKQPVDGFFAELACIKDIDLDKIMW